MKLDKILVSVMKFDENFFSKIFLNHVTFWCQITDIKNTILEVFNLVSSTNENIFTTFLTDKSIITLKKKREKNLRLTAVHCG